MKTKNKLVYWVMVVVMGVFAARLSGNVWRLWKAGERLKQAESEVRKQELENQELKKRLAEVRSPEFIEKEAREKFGLGTPLLNPSNLESPDFAKASPGKQTPNWQKWWKLYIN